MNPTSRIAHIYLQSAKALSDRMLEELQASQPDLAASVAESCNAGEHLALAIHFGAEPVIELAAVSDYGTSRRIASIELTAKRIAN